MTNKSKKDAKKAKEQLLKEQRAAAVEALRAEKVSAPVSFVLEPERKMYDPSLPGMGLLSPETLEALANYGKMKAPAAAPQSSPAASSSLEPEDARVVVDGRTDDESAAGHRGGGGGGDRGHKDDYKIPWPKLKIHMLETRTDRTAVECARLVEEHDGNAIDPLFTMHLKCMRGTVPVPSHWSVLSEFLSKQADRESAVGVVPPEVEATGVKELRASKDPKVFLNMNRIAFVRCFSVGTPLARKTFGVRLTSYGDVFEEGEMRCKKTLEPGKLSRELREALGMKTPTAPPPWLQAIQVMQRLPPALPFLRIPGVNAPIPDGCQWGGGEGMWGFAPRNDNGSPTFPGVMGELHGMGTAPVVFKQPWGSVPPPGRPSAAQPTQVVAADAAAKPSPPPAPTTAPTTSATPPPTAAPFMPTPFQAPMTAAQRAGPVREMEYTRRSDVVVGTGIIAQGELLVPRTADPAAATPQQAPPPPPPPAKSLPAKQPPGPTRF